MAGELGLVDLSGDTNNSIWCRHPLAFLVEAADDICYGIIDLEDGCRLGLVGYNETEELLIPIVGEKFDRKKLDRYKSMEEKVGILRAMSIANLIEECCGCFLDHENDILSAKFDTSLTDEINSSLALEQISKISLDKIYRSRKVLETEAVGYEVLPGLLDILSESFYYKVFEPERFSGKHQAIVRLLPAEYQSFLSEKDLEVYDIILLCTDFVCNMTDTGAISFYRLLKGIDLPVG